LRPAQAVQLVSAFGQVIAVALAASIAFLSAHFFLRIVALVTAGLVFLVSYQAGRADRLKPQTED
jgi:hypothetical protein